MELSGSLNRIRRVWQQHKDQGVDAILIENPVDLFYLTHLQLSAGVLLIVEAGAYLFLDGRYLEYAKNTLSSSFTIHKQNELGNYLSSLIRIGFDQQNTSYHRWEALKRLSSSQMIPLNAPTQYVRAIKDREELQLLEQSALLNQQGFEHLLSHLQEGVTEQELAMRFEIFCLEHGAQKMAFDPIIAFGKNTAYPHYRGKECQLRQGDSIICDVGVVIEGYHSDMTRTLFFGQPNPILLNVQEAIQEAYAAAVALCYPGIEIGAIDDAASRVIAKRGFEPYLVHSLGHGVGLDIHEYPRIRSQGENHVVKLEENMVITIEPGLYLPGVGGYRFENTLVITQEGAKNFYPNL
ncbi:MAG: Xaa-Pro peptidase family protein [Candidatus Rhabdochlamydia sp.]